MDEIIAHNQAAKDDVFTETLEKCYCEEPHLHKYDVERDFVSKKRVKEAIAKLQIFKSPNPDYPKLREIMNRSLDENCKDAVEKWNVLAFEIKEQLEKELVIE